jgi:hypothetical protein
VRKSALVEYTLVVLVVVAVQAFSYVTQPRIQLHDGQGYDGADYFGVAKQVVDGERLNGTARFARRVGTPLLAALVNPRQLIEGFFLVNIIATLLSCVLLLMWFRKYLTSSWLRVGLVVLFATHWLQLVRLTFFYPVLVDPWTQACCFAGLNCIAWYERNPGSRPLVALSLISVAGVLFRELALLIPLAVLFARNPRLEHLKTIPYLQVHNFPRIGQWIPMALACAALFAVSLIVVPRDPNFSVNEHLGTRAVQRSLVVYLLGWLIAFGPALLIVLFDWRSAARFLSQHRGVLAYTVGVAVIAWVGSNESERHALNSASPVVYLLLGLTIQGHPGWFKSPALIAFLLATQALVHRVFLTTPEPGVHLEPLPAVLLTPIGSNTSYLHLFPAYIAPSMAQTQFTQFMALAVVTLFWLSRRAHLHDPDLQARRALPVHETSST